MLTFTDSLISISVNNISKVFRRNSSFLADLGLTQKKNSSDDIKALSNISFTIKKGEAFGIIGRNGSGKSTLLQIITGTLKPSEGSVLSHGRISALLELGSGFNPDFTGTENIYLAGSILGISKTEMDLRYDDIVSFADIGNFLNQPVKTYSSGMLMRVAFSVAVAVQPDILIIDEALSVGDIIFQQKCNQRIRELINKGVTLLVVTHDTSFVLNICTRAMWLDSGRCAFLGDAALCVKEYITRMTADSGNDLIDKKPVNIIKNKIAPVDAEIDTALCKRLGGNLLNINKIWILNQSRESSSVFIIGDWIEVVFVISATKSLKSVSGGCELRDRHGQVIFATGLRVINQLIDELQTGQSKVISIKFKLDISAGQYTLDVGSGSGNENSNIWQRLSSVAVIDVRSTKDTEIVHGLVKLPYHIEVSEN
jgi:lipopolysaccharide transport system ATP-binding protein